MFTYQIEDNVVIINFKTFKGYIRVITPSIINIADKSEIPSFAVENKDFPNCTFDVIKEKDSLLIRTNSLIVKVSDNFKVDFYNLKNEEICIDYLSENKKHLIEVTKKLKDDECIYGLGDKISFLNKRGYDYINWNTDDPSPHLETYKSLYKSIPFIICFNKKLIYGIFFDNHYKTFFDLGKTHPDYYSFGTDEGHLNYYFIYGNNFTEVVKGYTFLTGRAPLPQLWTLGAHQSRWSYFTEEEVRDIANNYRKHQIPLDCIHIDIDYMDKYKVFTISNERFPTFKKMVDDLNNQGIKAVTIIDPGVKVEEGYGVYEEGIKEGYFATYGGETYVNAVWPGDSVFPSFISEKVRHWWKSKTKFLTDLGIRGIWDDMNEPASFKGPLPDDVVFPGDDRDYLHKEIHNVYGHLMAKATYDGLKEYDKKRPFVITRACYSGTQKYSIVWTGDNTSIWTHLQFQIPQLCTLGISGFPYCGTDIGGFGGDTNKELLIRWVEASCFVPFFRNHTANGTRRQEPWQFDDETLNIYRKYVVLRYSFIPYLYDLAYEIEKSGAPILRPLAFHYQDDVKTHNLNDQYLVGESILVAPIVNQGQRARMVYLPQGEWIDYWSKKVHKGGQYIIKDAPLDTLPIFIKNNSIIVQDPPYDYLDPKLRKELIIDIYGEKAKYYHYLDDGESFDYKDGKYQVYLFEVRNSVLTIERLRNNNIHYDRFIIRYKDQEFIIEDINTKTEIKL